MALPLPTTTDVQIVRVVKALFDAAPGNTYLTAFQDDVAENGLTAFANGLAAYVSTDAATLASTVVANLGLTGDSATNGELYLLQEFAANPGNYGLVILNAMNALAGMEADPIFGADAAAYNASVLAAYTYSIDADNTTTNLVTLMAADEAEAANVGQTFTLTTGLDTVAGTSGNDTINGSDTTFTGLDTIDGGAGTDSLKLSDVAGGTIDVAIADVTNVETLVLTSVGDLGSDAADVSGWTGLTSATFVLKDLSADQTITVDDTTDVTISNTTSGAFDIDVLGGKVVTITADKTAATDADVSVTGAAGLTTVTVTNGSAVVIADNGTEDDTLTTVSLDGFDDASTIASDALTTLGAANSAENVTITAAAGTRTLSVTVDTLATGGLLKDDTATTLNLTASGDDSVTSFEASAATTVAITADVALELTDLVAEAATSISIAGDSLVTIDTAATLSALESAAVSGSASVDLDLGTTTSLTEFTSTSTGDIEVIFDDNAVSVSLGAGDDTVTYNNALDDETAVALGAGDDTFVTDGDVGAGAADQVVDGGADTDTIRLGAADDVVAADIVTNFEVLDITGTTVGTTDMDFLAGVTSVVATAALGGAIVIDDAAAGTTVTLTAADGAALTTGALLTYDLKTDAADSSLTFTLATADDADKAAGDGADDSLEIVTVTDFTADDIETLNLVTSVTNVDDGDEAADYVHVITNATLADTTTIDVSGNASLTITDIDSSTLLSKVDASDLTGNLTINLSTTDTTKAVAFLGGSGIDTVTASGNANDILVGNAGADVFTLAAAGTKETVRYIGDQDSVLTLTETDDPSDDLADGAEGYDVVTNFTTTEDKIELSSLLGLGTGDARTAITGKGSTIAASFTNEAVALALQSVIDDGVDFFNDGTTDRAVATYLIDDSTTSPDANDILFVFVDANADGNFVASQDLVVALAGVESIVISDIVFG